MRGGAVMSGNTATNGGGVYVAANGTFIMEGNAAVSGNTASTYGSGVYVAYGTYNMTGGSVGGNEAVQGGGVAVAYAPPTYFGSFHMADGVIYGTNHTVDSEKNKATNNYAALFSISSGYAQYGTFAPDGTFSGNGNLPSTDSTITVTGGNLVSP